MLILFLNQAVVLNRIGEIESAISCLDCGLQACETVGDKISGKEFERESPYRSHLVMYMDNYSDNAIKFHQQLSDSKNTSRLFAMAYELLGEMYKFDNT